MSARDVRRLRGRSSPLPCGAYHRKTWRHVPISSALRFWRKQSQDTQQATIWKRLTMPTDRVVEYDNAGIPKLFSIELLHRKLDIEGLFGHGIYGIFATPRDEAMRIFAESDVRTVLTDPTTDRQTHSQLIAR